MMIAWVIVLILANLRLLIILLLTNSLRCDMFSVTNQQVKQSWCQ